LVGHARVISGHGSYVVTTASAGERLSASSRTDANLWLRMTDSSRISNVECGARSSGAAAVISGRTRIREAAQRKVPQIWAAAGHTDDLSEDNDPKSQDHYRVLKPIEPLNQR
jgi:hypothetical protein